MKIVYLIHRWGGNPESDWYSSVKEKLESNGFEMIILVMPKPEKPMIKEWIEEIDKNISKLNSEDEIYFIGHSIGCQAILRFLDGAEIKVRGILFVAPWLHLQNLGNDEEEIAKQWLETEIDFDKAKEKYEKMTCIFSDNDPWVPLSDKDIFKEKLGAKIIVEHDKGHFTEDDNVVENQVVINEILKMEID